MRDRAADSRSRAVVAGDGKVRLNRNVVNGSEPILRLIGGLPAGTAVAIESAFGTAGLLTAGHAVQCAIHDCRIWSRFRSRDAAGHSAGR